MVSCCWRCLPTWSQWSSCHRLPRHTYLLAPTLSTDLTPIAQHKSWKELQRLPNPTLHFTDTDTGTHRRERLGQGHTAHWFKGWGENCPTGDSPCVSSFSQPVLLLSTLAGFQTLDTRSTPSWDVPAACQSVSPGVNNPSWPGALYLQGNEKCKHCVGFREMLWSIHHCVSAKSVMLTRKQCLHIVYDLWDFSALLPYNFQLASNENFSTAHPPFDVTANIYLGDTGYLPFAKHYGGFGDTRMRRYYGGCFHIVTGLGVSPIDTQKPPQVSIREGQILLPFPLPFLFLPPPQYLCFLLLFLVLFLIFKIFLKTGSHYAPLDGLELTEIIPSSTSQMLRLKKCATTPGF